MTRSLSEQIFFNDERLRSGWRIAVFLLLFVVLFLIGHVAVASFPPEASLWVSATVLLVSALVSGWIVLARLDGRPIGALGFAFTPAAAKELVAGFGLGGILLAAAAALLLVTGAVHWVPDAGGVGEYIRTLVRTLIFFAIAATAEELLLRGYPFQALVEGIGSWPATALMAAIFSLLHAENPNVGPLALVNIFFAGVLLSVAYLRTRSLWFPTGIHIGWNWTMASLLDFPVSGLTFSDTPLYTAAETGADWWTGGVFGPEAGLAATVVLVVGTLAIVRSGRLSESPRMRALRPIVNRRLDEAPL